MSRSRALYHSPRAEAVEPSLGSDYDYALPPLRGAANGLYRRVPANL